jgi:hypothetical protein
MAAPSLIPLSPDEAGDRRNTLEQLKQQIESFAPQVAEYQQERERLYADLAEAGIPKDTPTYGDDVCVFVLESIYTAQREEVDRARATTLCQWYRQERARVKKLLK